MKNGHEPLMIYRMPDGSHQTLPFYLPEGKARNGWKLEHLIRPAGSDETLVSMRNALMMGLRPCKTSFTHDTTIHRLIHKGDVWMTSHGQEIEQHHRQLRFMRGRVLVGGLGLGLAVAILDENPKVKEITVVEKSLDVIRLVKDHLPSWNVEVIHDDLFEFLKSCQRGGRRWDCAFYDIWQPTGETIINEYTMPLRKLSIGIVDQKRIQMWNEDEAIGQTRFGIMTQLMMGFDHVRKMKDEEFETRMAGYRHVELPWWRYARSTGDWGKASADRFIRSLKDAVRWEQDWEKWDAVGTAS